MGARAVAEDLVEFLKEKGVRANILTYRDGFVTIIAEGSKRIAIWVRLRPITKASLNMIKRILAKYEIDGILVYRNSEVIDFVRNPFPVFLDPEELLKIVNSEREYEKLTDSKR